MSDCIFCKIVEGSIPSSIVFEDDTVYSFLDINPASKGHFLVIPKKHVEDISELGDTEITAIFSAIRKLTKALPDVLGNTGFNILMNYGKDAGQIISHLHFHIIPRKKEDGLGIAGWNHLKFSGDHLNEIAKEIAEAIK
ncbi:MAG: HIT family protein [Candidatus Aureabacteria bacterium]|nr:HIT family protein [Candidatus Auribacterota bacterium]